FLHLDGSPGVIDGKIPDADPLSRAVYALGDLLCHQQQARTFAVNGSEIAFCMRDASFMAGAAGGMALLYFLRPPSGDARPVLIGALLFSATFAEWAAEVILNIDAPVARIATGVASGIGAAVLFRYWAAPALFPAV
ncbi:MAG: DUF2085 domain-containing protein, partial [Candidatus Methanoplasma sp.]|nr:DUF2085 domain-containing protein [Candidatus Methanoplasma sp.]